MTATDVNGARGYEAMAIAGVALGRPHEAVRELLRLAWSHAPPNVRAREQTIAEAHLAVLEGRFDDAGALATQVDQTIAADTTASVHGRVTEILVQIALERGDAPGAAALARDFLAKQSAWTESPDVTTGFFLRVRRDAGDLDARAYRAARDAAEPPVVPFQWADTYLDRPARAWLSLFVMPAASPEDAAEALHAQPEGMAIPTGASSLPLIDEAIGRALLLAGRPGDALPRLRAAARTCTALSQPFIHTSASYMLGRALEASGDKPAACDAYAVVLRRWGSAKPRSMTAQHARARADALGCKPAGN
jgi:serine/threonine-protein kinase